MFAFIHTVKNFLFKSKKRAVASVIVLLILIVACWQVFAAQKPKAQYQTATVTRGTLVVSVSESGQMVSTGSLPVSTLASGIVKQVLVKNGDSVTQGQEIMEITPDQTTVQNQTQALATYQNAVNNYNDSLAAKTAAQASLEKDRATVISASSAVTTMQNNINTSQNNPATKLSYTQNDIDAINSALTSSRETFTADEKKYLDADANIAAAGTAQSSTWQTYQQSATKIVAPVAGVIKDITYAPGMAISAGATTVTTGTGSSSSSNSRSTSTVAMIQTASDIVPAATFNLTEVDMPKVHEGQHATLTLDALPGKSFTGTVIGVNREGAVSSGVTNYPVTIQLDASFADIAPNMSATANIIIDTKSDVLLVPSGAVQTSSGQSFVRVLKNGMVTSVPVEVGESSDTQTEIISGLNEGDTVVIGSLASQSSTTTGAASPFSRSLFGGGGFGGGGGRGGGGGAARGN